MLRRRGGGGLCTQGVKTKGEREGPVPGVLRRRGGLCTQGVKTKGEREGPVPGVLSRRGGLYPGC